jgi:ketosteroid isomerase-like protein
LLCQPLPNKQTHLIHNYARSFSRSLENLTLTTNNGDAAALAALYTEDAIEVTDQGPIYGRKALEKHFADVFQKVHFSNHLLTLDQDSPHIIGTTGNEVWETGAWSQTIQGQNFGPIQLKGYHSSIAVREGGIWKKRLVTWNITPAPAAPAQAK